MLFQETWIVPKVEMMFQIQGIKNIVLIFRVFCLFGMWPGHSELLSNICYDIQCYMEILLIIVSDSIKIFYWDVRHIT